MGTIVRGKVMCAIASGMLTTGQVWRRSRGVSAINWGPFFHAPRLMGVSCTSFLQSCCISKYRSGLTVGPVSEVRAVARALALRDYYPFWKHRNERSRAGKLLLLDPNDHSTIQARALQHFSKLG